MVDTAEKRNILTSLEQKSFSVLIAFFCGAIALSITLGSKIFIIFGLTASVSALTYPITFLVTDVVAEIWGKDRAKRVVYYGLIIMILSFVLIRIAISLPSAPFWEGQEAYARIFGTSLRIIMGGIVAYFVSQFHDIWAFHFWKRLTHGKHLWLRNNLSTWVSQLIDTIIFITIAFSGLAPLVPLIVGQYVIKVAMAVLDTPIVYLVVGNIKKRIGVNP